MAEIVSKEHVPYEIKAMNLGQTGSVGEQVACEYLERMGHRIVKRNFRVKSGEIDIVSQRGNGRYFVEVKTVDISNALDAGSARPEERVDYWKLRRLSRAVQIYLEKFPQGRNETLHFAVVAIKLDTVRKTACVKIIEDVLE